MILEVEFIKERRGSERFKGIATADGEVACDVRPSPGGLHQ